MQDNKIALCGIIVYILANKNLMMSFEKYANQSYSLLTQLFGVSEYELKKNRLEEIFNVSENAWSKNLERLKNVEVKYLLIGEAPPWSDEGQVFYFYETFNKNRGGGTIRWIDGVWNSLMRQPRTSSLEENLKQLAKSQFLLIDSLPFAMQYSTNIRKSPQYKKLIALCDEYFLEKIKDLRISWAKDVKVAIAFDYNGRALIERFPDEIILPNGTNIVLQNAIVTSGNGFPTKNTLSQKWSRE